MYNDLGFVVKSNPLTIFCFVVFFFKKMSIVLLNHKQCYYCWTIVDRDGENQIENK